MTPKKSKAKVSKDVVASIALKLRAITESFKAGTPTRAEHVNALEAVTQETERVVE